LGRSVFEGDRETSVEPKEPGAGAIRILPGPLG
jgi:hypothetical protein